MVKFGLLSVLLAGLAACAPQPKPQGYFDSLTPDPAGFERMRQRELLMAAERQSAATTTADAPRDFALDETAMADAAAPVTESPTISRTQDFAVITERETIESDAARLRSLAADYQVIQPEPLPERTSEVNLADYAVNQANQVGNKIYIRNGGSESRCFAYRDPDEAQRVFLSSGGPRLDPRNLDLDGDGFACDWTPDAYRALVR